MKKNALLTDLREIDAEIDFGYEIVNEAEWQYTNTGSLYPYIFSKKGIFRDEGISRFDDLRA